MRGRRVSAPAWGKAPENFIATFTRRSWFFHAITFGKKLGMQME
jgi:hypothetical protein